MTWIAIHAVSQGLRTAATEVDAAVQAHNHYQKPPLTAGDKIYCWIQGLCTGIGRAMQEYRATVRTQVRFDPTEFPVVSFSAHNNGRALLLIEVISKDATGNPVKVTSTLNYVEAQCVRVGIDTLRSTGIFSLADHQANDLLTCTATMIDPKRAAKRADPRVPTTQPAN